MEIAELWWQNFEHNRCMPSNIEAYASTLEPIAYAFSDEGLPTFVCGILFSLIWCQDNSYSMVMHNTVHNRITSPGN